MIKLFSQVHASLVQKDASNAAKDSSREISCLAGCFVQAGNYYLVLPPIELQISRASESKPGVSRFVDIENGAEPYENGWGKV